jgi:4-hydroxymandelate oxidase
MYTARVPAVSPATTLRITAAGRRLFSGASALALNPSHQADLSVYLADMVRPFGLALRSDIGDADRGYSYGEMAEALIADLVPAQEPVDVLVLVFAVPDVRPGRATAVYLSHVCPGNPLAFAVCDQGRVGAFAGLRLLREYARTGGCRRGLLVVAEQSTVHYPSAAPVALPSRHAAVALLCEVDPAPGALVSALRQLPDVPPESVPDRLARELAALDATDATLIVGSPTGGGQPDTEVWWELAAALSATGPERVVVAQYEPLLRYLCVAVVDRRD